MTPNRQTKNLAKRCWMNHGVQIFANTVAVIFFELLKINQRLQVIVLRIDQVEL